MKWIALLALFVLVPSVIVGWPFVAFPAKNAPLVVAPLSPETTVLLLPLDSRPACTKFPSKLGALAGLRVVTPPKELLDHYRKPGDRAALHDWLTTEAPRAKAVIVSADMLLYGGLLASRQSDLTEDALAALGTSLENLRRDHPMLPIYVFQILPRPWVTEMKDTRLFQNDLLRYSALREETLRFENPRDFAELERLQAEIPYGMLRRYDVLYDKTTAASRLLLQLAQNGVVTKLVFGQDDGQIFGLGNLARRRLERDIRAMRLTDEQVAVTKGADEVALTLLGELNFRRTGYRPKVCVRYGDSAAPSVYMPYMPHSVATTVREKLSLLRAESVATPEEADFTLFVHIGTEKNKRQLYPISRALRNLVDAGHKVALVDLSRAFDKEETLLPQLLSGSTSLHALIAYAGWNTTSNSIGMALAQATLFTNALKQSASTAETLSLYDANLTFLTERYLEDWYYLKESIDLINNKLRSYFIDPYALSAASHEYVSWDIHNELGRQAARLKQSRAYRQFFAIETPAGPLRLAVADLATTAKLPWPRTFEIDLDAKLSLVQYLQDKEEAQ